MFDDMFVKTIEPEVTTVAAATYPPKPVVNPSDAVAVALKEAELPKYPVVVGVPPVPSWNK